MIRLQGVNEALEELGQFDAGGLLVVDSEAPAVHIHNGNLGRDALSGIDKPAGPEGEVMM